MKMKRNLLVIGVLFALAEAGFTSPPTTLSPTLSPTPCDFVATVTLDLPGDGLLNEGDAAPEFSLTVSSNHNHAPWSVTVDWWISNLFSNADLLYSAATLNDIGTLANSHYISSDTSNIPTTLENVAMRFKGDFDFSPSQDTTTFKLPLVDDSIDEGLEQLVVTMSASAVCHAQVNCVVAKSRTLVGSPQRNLAERTTQVTSVNSECGTQSVSAYMFIVDNDTASLNMPAELTVQEVDVSNPGASREVKIPVTLSNALTYDLTVDVHFNGITAEEHTDWVSGSNANSSGSNRQLVTISAGQTEAFVSLKILNDDVQEYEEELLDVWIADLSYDARILAYNYGDKPVVVGSARCIVTIKEVNDITMNSVADTPSISLQDFSPIKEIRESDSSFVVTILSSNAVKGYDMKVDWAIQHVTTSDADFVTPVSGTATILSDTMEVEVEVILAEDGFVEGIEEFIFTLSNMEHADQMQDDGYGLYTIDSSRGQQIWALGDDDFAEIVWDTSTAVEGLDADVEITGRLTKPCERTLVILSDDSLNSKQGNYALSSSGSTFLVSYGPRFSAASYSVTVPPGEVEFTLGSVAITDDETVQHVKADMLVGDFKWNWDAVVPAGYSQRGTFDGIDHISFNAIHTSPIVTLSDFEGLHPIEIKNEGGYIREGDAATALFSIQLNRIVEADVTYNVVIDSPLVDGDFMAQYGELGSENEPWNSKGPFNSVNFSEHCIAQPVSDLNCGPTVTVSAGSDMAFIHCEAHRNHINNEERYFSVTVQSREPGSYSEDMVPLSIFDISGVSAEFSSAFIADADDAVLIAMPSGMNAGSQLVRDIVEGETETLEFGQNYVNRFEMAVDINTERVKVGEIFSMSAGDASIPVSLDHDIVIETFIHCENHEFWRFSHEFEDAFDQLSFPMHWDELMQYMFNELQGSTGGAEYELFNTTPFEQYILGFPGRWSLLNVNMAEYYEHDNSDLVVTWKVMNEAWRWLHGGISMISSFSVLSAGMYYTDVSIAMNPADGLVSDAYNLWVGFAMAVDNPTMDWSFADSELDQNCRQKLRHSMGTSASVVATFDSARPNLWYPDIMWAFRAFLVFPGLSGGTSLYSEFAADCNVHSSPSSCAEPPCNCQFPHAMQFALANSGEFPTFSDIWGWSAFVVTVHDADGPATVHVPNIANWEGGAFEGYVVVDTPVNHPLRLKISCVSASSGLSYDDMCENAGGHVLVEIPALATRVPFTIDVPEDNAVELPRVDVRDLPLSLTVASPINQPKSQTYFRYLKDSIQLGKDFPKFGEIVSGMRQDTTFLDKLDISELAVLKNPTIDVTVHNPTLSPTQSPTASPTERPRTCKGLCGKPVPDAYMVGDDRCFCDDNCVIFGDCCTDHEYYCRSCEDKCGMQVHNCFCDESCTEYGDCCVDHYDQCSDSFSSETCSTGCDDILGGDIRKCHCDLQALAFGDACADYNEYCDSCANHCNGPYMANRMCQCDEQCEKHGDCCNDAHSCAASNVSYNFLDPVSWSVASGSCSGRCGDDYDAAEGCQCDDTCAEHNDCCVDKNDAC